MPERTAEDRLREEYFDLLPEVRRVAEQMEAKIRYHLLPTLRRLAKFEQVVVKSRIKECESALQSLRRRQEGATFASDLAGEYTLSELPDLAGVRVLAFPRTRLVEIDEVLRPVFPGWTFDPVRGDRGETLAFKYRGYCSEASSRVRGEYQIVSMLIGLFWEVEHSAVYKAMPQLMGVARDLDMQGRTQDVLTSLTAFEVEFERTREEAPGSPPVD